MPKNDTSNDASTETTEPQGFYGRWSRRKQQARDGELPVEDETATESATEPATAVAVTTEPGEVAADSLDPELETPEAPVLTDADMPTLESLGAESDYSGFMSEGVSEELRNKALRQLFRSPQFNITDGLDDYCEDFRNFELLGDIVTADMKYEREYEAQRIREREEEQAALEQEQEQEREQAKVLEEEGETPLQADSQDESEEVEAEDQGESLDERDEGPVVVADVSTQVSTEAKPDKSVSDTQTIHNQNDANPEVSPKAINSETHDNAQGGFKQ